MRLENTGRHINTDEVKLKTPALALHALPSRMAGQPSRLIRISTTVHSVKPLYFIYQYTLCNKCVVMRYVSILSGHGLQIGVNMFWNTLTVKETMTHPLRSHQQNKICLFSCRFSITHVGTNIKTIPTIYIIRSHSLLYNAHVCSG